MLSDNQKEKLKANWGDKAEALACNAEVRVYDPASPWECYIYALNPDDEDEVKCIVKVSDKHPATLEPWFLTNIKSLFNRFGDNTEVDPYFKPRHAAELLKYLNHGLYDSRRD